MLVSTGCLNGRSKWIQSMEQILGTVTAKHIPVMADENYDSYYTDDGMRY
jgi:hypothetical protein